MSPPPPLVAASARVPDAALPAAPEDRGRSLVAGANALFRWAEARRPDGGRILHDPYAGWFAEDDPRVAAVRYGRFLAPPLWAMVDALQTVHCVRHRSIDRLVEAALGDGFRQVVIVGAGYDSRAFRLDGAGAAKWFEADHPATQARKARILAARTERLPPVRRVGVDLGTGSLAQALAMTDFDFDAPACFVLEGLIHYLAPERLEQLLADTARGLGRRRLCLSFIQSAMYRRAPGIFVRLVKLVREIPRLHFEPGALRALLQGHGYEDFQSFDLEAQVARFAPQARGRRAKVSQDVAVAERPVQRGRVVGQPVQSERRPGGP